MATLRVIGQLAVRNPSFSQAVPAMRAESCQKLYKCLSYEQRSSLCTAANRLTSFSVLNRAFCINKVLLCDSSWKSCRTVFSGQQPKITANTVQNFLKSHGTVLFSGNRANKGVQLTFFRGLHEEKESWLYKRKTAITYAVAAVVFMTGISYVMVPAYKIFCATTGRGGADVKGHDAAKVPTMKKTEDREFTIHFDANTHSKMKWKFQPQQREMTVAPGETALAFYTATNPTDKPIVGISTYNILPYSAGLYFNKIQCFCFEDQLLNPHEQVDMPVFFYLDPDIVKDPDLVGVNTITLSYTFFESKAGMNLPLPGFQQFQQTPNPTPVPATA